MLQEPAAPPPVEAAPPAAPLPEGELKFVEPSGGDKFWTRCKLIFALPWRRFKKDSVLTMKLEGEISDQARGRFDPGLSMPQVCAVPPFLRDIPES